MHRSLHVEADHSMTRSVTSELEVWNLLDLAIVLSSAVALTQIGSDPVADLTLLR